MGSARRGTDLNIILVGSAVIALLLDYSSSVEEGCALAGMAGVEALFVLGNGW